MGIVHYSVLQNEALEWLKPLRANELMIDGTLGEGGHSELFLSSYPDLKVIGLDTDENIQAVAKKRLEPFGDRMAFYLTWFDRFFNDYPAELDRPDIVLLDLGISVFHYEKAGRGFSFRKDEPLDMRLNANLELSAADVVNRFSETDIADLIFQYGEERYSRRIARAIVEYRREKSIETTKELAEIVWNSVPVSYRHGRIHPSTRTFQAIRIVVNQELDRIKPAIEAAIKVLKVGGRLGVITFHSLEDRIVKHLFKDLNKSCICPPEEPICKCRGIKIVDILTRKPIVPTEEEIKENSPSRSAKLRVVKKVNEEQDA